MNQPQKLCEISEVMVLSQAGVNKLIGTVFEYVAKLGFGKDRFNGKSMNWFTLRKKRDPIANQKGKIVGGV